MEKRKFKLRYLYEGGATMGEFYNVPVIGIELENRSHISSLHGSDEKMTAEDALQLAEAYGCALISLKDFSQIRTRQADVRKMFAQAGSPLNIVPEYIWTQDPDTGEVEAYSLVNGHMLQHDKTAGVLLKYK